MFGLLDLGLIGIGAFIILCLILLPVILTIIVGVAFANYLGFSGIYWWAFVIFFYLIIGAIFSAVGA